MWRKREKQNVYHTCMDSKPRLKTMFSVLKCWITLTSFTGIAWCDAVQVTVRDDRRFAMLFQSVVLPCQYSSHSTQTPVVQWLYKSYCRDRTRDAFSFPDSLGVRGSELGVTSHLDCSDTGRTVRTVVSLQGSSITLAEYYKGRDISIINKADLRIGELHWGDSGVYYCKVVISDDLEGQNEAKVELLVLGQTGVADDLLPEIDLKFMPEWVFVGAVVLGSGLFLVLAGVCWCQCCPHSCCCYVRCCCCPETCCCPQHLYEAGKGIKTTLTTPVAMYPPYYVPGVPSMVPISPPSLIEAKMSTVPSIDNNSSACHQLSACSRSELSSLHESETDFRQTYRQVQKKALPAIPDLDDPADLLSGQMSPVRAQRPRHPLQRLEEQYPRWMSRSEHLQRKDYQMGGRTGSLDELEEFAMGYTHRGNHNDFDVKKDDYRTSKKQRPCESAREQEWHQEQELECNRYPHYSMNHYYPKDGSDKPHSPSPSFLPEITKRRRTGNSVRPIPDLRRCDFRDQDDESGQEYDDALLRSLLAHKAKAGRNMPSKGFWNEEELKTPSKNGSKKSYHRAHSPSSRSASKRQIEDESLPPYTERETERFRNVTTSQKHLTSTHSPKENREERSRPRKVNTLLSRDSLIV